MTLDQAKLVLEERDRYPEPIVDEAVGLVMEELFLEDILSRNRE